MTSAPPPRRNQLPHLNVAGAQEPAARWQPTSDQWRDIENGYGLLDFPVDLRREIERIVNCCLFWQDFEKGSLIIKSTGKGQNKETGVRERLERIGNLANQLHAELTGCLHDNGAGQAAMLGMIKHMPARAVAGQGQRQATSRQILAAVRKTLDSDEERDVWDHITAEGVGRPPRARPEDILQRIRDISLGVQGYGYELDDIERRRGGFDVLDAWTQAIRDFAAQMLEWEYIVSASKDPTRAMTSPFVGMVIAIDQSLPVDKQLRRNSNGAYAKFISDALS